MGKSAERSLADRRATLKQRLEALLARYRERSTAAGPSARAAEWLLDNAHLVDEALRQVAQDLPAGFVRSLPRLLSGTEKGELRIVRLARQAWAESVGPLDLDRVRELAASGEVELTIGELWALPALLRLELLEGLARAADAALAASATTARETDLAAPISAAILSLRALGAHDWKTFVEAVSGMERELREDPAGVYARMDFATRDAYRKAVEELARRSGRSEVEAARSAVARSRQAEAESRARHVGFHLLGEGRDGVERALGYRPPLAARPRRWVLKHPALAYFGSLAVTTLSAVALALVVAAGAGVAPLGLLLLALLLAAPAGTVAAGIVNVLAAWFLPPRELPKLELGRDLPDDCRTLVVVPSLLTSEQEVRALLVGLEESYLGNAGVNLGFALLSDFGDAPAAEMPADAALLRLAADGLRDLERRHAAGTPRFFLIHRPRLWNPAAGVWMGWERKRGKLAELARHLAGAEDTGLVFPAGDLSSFGPVRYVITLDADTVLPRGAAARLAGTLAHPLNRAEVAADGRVVAGYSILQPRLEVTPASAARTRFARLFSGETGIDLYTHAVSNVYQDVFGIGIYTGKGIFDPFAFAGSLADRVPDNALLSHDLFEGLHGRTALVADEAFFEDYPPNLLISMRRQHRWVRGDWQLLPWLARRVPAAQGGTLPNRLSPLGRFLILDNLRRSLVAPCLLVALAAGWLWFPSSWLWTVLLVALLALPMFLGGLTATLRLLGGAAWRPTVAEAAGTLPLSAARSAAALAFLPFEAWTMVDAIWRTLIRLTVTRRHLLQWTTAAHTQRRLGEKPSGALFLRQMAAAPAISGVLALLVAVQAPHELPAALPLLALWAASPLLAAWLGRPLTWRRETLSSAEAQPLRLMARRTWHFFERFVGPDDHWLPPDNFQAEPGGIVAHRTSPTNVGMLLLSNLAAYDLGYLGVDRLVARLANTLATLDRLQIHQGHLWNWYETTSLTPLEPRYVSTVDSANLAASLLTVARGCEAAAKDPAAPPAQREGLCDVLGVLEGVVHEIGSGGSLPAAAALARELAQVREQVEAAAEPTEWARLVRELQERWLPAWEQRLLGLAEAGEAPLEAPLVAELATWADRLGHALEVSRAAIDRVPWLLAEPGSGLQGAWREMVADLPTTPRLDQVPALAAVVRERLSRLETEETPAWIADLRVRLDRAQASAEAILGDLGKLARRCDAWVERMDFSFLFDRERQLFHIGYNASAREIDPHHYDLLASEARLASLLAIATNAVPQSHWTHLGRPWTRVGSTLALLSWGGTMFELLLPRVWLAHPEGTPLAESCRAAVARQIAFARNHGIPWGISESGYAELDAHRSYRYRSFGVPGLGLKRDLGDRLVVTPYGSLLALPVAPRAVAANVERLAKLGMLGRYGLYEAVDFGPASGRPRPRVVTSYMAHHQGMILAALANCLCGDSLVRRFHADPRIATIELLLNERLPRGTPRDEAPGAAVEAGAAPFHFEQAVASVWPAPERGGRPARQILSNGRLSVMVTSRGGGSSRLAGRVLVRGQADPSLEPRGTLLYVEDLAEGAVWMAFGQGCEAHFAPHLVELHARHQGLALRSAVAVAPDDDLEARLVRIVNETDRPRRLALTSYGEVVLATPAEDRRHPAFASLFVESAWNEKQNALVFRRRPRSSAEEPIAIAHTVVADALVVEPLRWETDRGRFLGRAGGYRQPAASSAGSPGLSGTTGATLDPVFAVRWCLDLPAGAVREVAFLTAAARSRRDALAILGRYSSLSRVHAVLEQARVHAGPLLREAGLPPEGARDAQELLSALLEAHPALRAEPAVLAANRRGQAALWPLGISGDLPILLARINRSEDAPLVRELLAVHAWWRRHRIEADLVILDEAATVYEKPIQDWLDREIARRGDNDWRDRPGGIYIVRGATLGEEDRTLLAAVAAAVIDASRGGLAVQLSRLRGFAAPDHLPHFVPSPSSPLVPEPTPPVERPAGLLFDNGFGGFTADGREYVIHLEPGRATPAPWINVIANPGFGMIASESGGGCTWALNSAENRLTPWRNDPVTDTPGEALYLRDEETGAIWTVTRQPAGGEAVCQIRHRAGSTSYSQHSHGLEQELDLFVPVAAPVKIAELRLTNRWHRPRRITATYFAELVLGMSRRATSPYVVSEYAAECRAILARCPFPEGGERTTFLASDRAPHGLTADRIEFLGQPPDRQRPAGLVRIGLAQAVGPGLDPCAALQIHLELKPGETVRACFLLGQGRDRQEAVALATRFRQIEAVDAARREVEAFWDSLLGRVQVTTPEPEIDLVVNRWLLYQTLSCRLWGRSALYQSSGGFGFRDQLQDVLGLLEAAPQIARAHLLEAARHQFEAGDVLHWWHPPDSRGVRTRCSDDLLWLPYVTATYVAVTGDRAILDEPVPFRAGPEVPAGEVERFDRYPQTPQTASLYEHCLLAIRRGDTAGAHGLPLIGSCDWNDGMSRVGAGGQGESVWLAWFSSVVLTDFAPLCEAQGDSFHADALRRRAAAVRSAVEQSAWDGQWYLRAFYDDGTPLGASNRRECAIDLIAQAWAVLAGGDPERAAQAMDAVWERLMSPEEGLTRLLAPPFDRGTQDPGYIKAYPPGVRENGGQYSHAAAWAAWAFTRLGDGNRALAVLRTILPTYRAATAEAALHYRVEPYVVAADIAGAPPHTGRGGWTWYTGTAAWTYRLVVEAILGLKRKPGLLEIDPCLPSDWPGYTAVLREGSATYRVRVENPEGVCRGIGELSLDGERLEGREVPLVDDGKEHEVLVRLASAPQGATVIVTSSPPWLSL